MASALAGMSSNRRWGAALAGALGIFGCAQVLGVDEYAIAENRPNGTGVLPVLPALPDSSPANIIPECTKCVADKCRDERKACLGSAQCKRLFECTAGGAEPCDDPNCLARCKDENPPSALFDAYFTCAFGIFASPCQVECNVGHNWGCIRGFTWDERAPGKVEESVDLVDQVLFRTPLATMVDVLVAPCGESIPDPNGAVSGAFGCDPGVRVDRFGHATVALSSFQFLLSVTGGEGERTRYYPRPISRSGRLTLTVASNYILREVSRFELGAEASRGIVLYHGNDCLGPAQIGVTMAPAPSGATTAFYWDTDGAMHADRVESTSGGFVDVPGELNVTIQGIRRDTGDVVSTSHPLVVADGWTTIVDLYPIDFTNH